MIKVVVVVVVVVVVIVVVKSHVADSMYVDLRTIPVTFR